MRPHLLTLLLAIGTMPACLSAATSQSPTDLSTHKGQELVERALANEIRAAEDMTHPMRYRLRKSSPARIIVKEIVETRDGDVARLISLNDAPLSKELEQREQTRLTTLLSDPGRQRHRKQAEADDLDRAMKVLRALPKAFVYQFVAMQGAIAKYTFSPNPAFHSQNLETHALTSMSGELWINTEAERVTHLEGHIKQDVDFGWGILGQLNKGGWIAMEQAEVAPHIWRNTEFKMVMSGRVVYKTKVFDTVEELTQFAPVPGEMNYVQAIHTLLTEQPATN